MAPFLVGCGASGTTDAETTTAVSESSAGPDDAPPELLDAAGVGPDAFAGRWRFLMYQEGNDVSGGFVTLAADGEGLGFDEFQPTEVFQGSTLEAIGIADGRLEMTFRFGKPDDAPDDFIPPTYTFTGRLADDGAVYGHMLFPNFNPEIIRLKKVPAGAMIGEAELAKTVLGPTEGRLAVQQALSAADPVAAYADLAASRPQSPAVFDGVRRFLQATDQLVTADPDTRRRLAEAFVENGRFWGEPPAAAAGLISALSLLRQGLGGELADELAEAAVAIAPEEVAPSWRRSLEIAGDLGRVSTARRDAEEARKLANRGEFDAARERLGGIPEELRLDPVVLYRTGEVAEEAGDGEAARRAFATLEVVPGLGEALGRSPLPGSLDFTPPEGRLTQSWLEANGSLDGLEELKRELYDEYLFHHVRADSDVPVEPGRELAAGPAGHLLELFTGQGCPPCVAADVALEALEGAPRTSSDLVVLRYHVHIPAPDPLATGPSVDRAGYYDVPGTPTLFVDGGMSRTPVPGPFARSGVVFDRLAAEVLDAEPTSTPIELVASASGDVIHVSARADAASLPEKTRLRVVLAEREIDFAAMNGIRRHHMIVRVMPGGSDGVGPTDGTLALEESIALPEVRGEVAAHLDDLERRLSDEERVLVFAVRPGDYKEWAVVAFLQDDETKAVLGTAVAPVEAGEAPSETASNEASNETEADDTPPTI